MKTLWIGLDITEKQFKELQKSRGADGAIKIAFPEINKVEFMGRQFKFSDLHCGGITDAKTGK